MEEHGQTIGLLPVEQARFQKANAIRPAGFFDTARAAALAQQVEGTAVGGRNWFVDGHLASAMERSGWDFSRLEMSDKLVETAHALVSTAW